MKSGSLWMLIAGVVLGLALGAAWSPRRSAGVVDDPGGVEAGGPTSGGHRSLTGSHGAGEPGKLPRNRARRTDRPDPGPRIGELSVDMMVEALASVRDETELNLMELARIAGMLTRISEGEAVDLLRQLTAEKEEEKGNAKQMRGLLGMIVFTRLCELNGPEAMRMMAEGDLAGKFGNETDELLALGMNSWVAADPVGARQWFDGLLGEVDQLALDGGMEEDMKNATGVMRLLNEDDLVEAYLRGMAKHDAEGLAESVDELRHEQVRESMEAKIFEAVVETETTADGMMALLQQYEGTEATNARIAAIRKLSELDNLRAAKWVEHHPVSAERDHLVTQVAGDMMKKDPAAGAAWYMEQAMHDANREADRLQRITWQWGSADYDATSTWLEGQPDGPTRDGAESSMARLAAGRKDWASSMAWARDIANEQVQAKAMEQVFRTGWDRTEKVMDAGLLEAADAAGFGEQAREYGAKK